MGRSATVLACLTFEPKSGVIQIIEASCPAVRTGLFCCSILLPTYGDAMLDAVEAILLNVIAGLILWIILHVVDADRK